MSGAILQDVHALPIQGAAPGHAPLYTGVIGFAGSPLGHAAPLDLEVVEVTAERVSFAAFAQAIFDAHPPPPVGQLSSFVAPPIGHDDPLLPAVSRFVAARPGAIGAGALMRRFGIGRKRAGTLLYVLSCSRVCLGWPVRGVFRVNYQAWPDLQGGA